MDKRVAFFKIRIANIRNGFCDRNAFKFFALFECVVVNFCYAFGNHDAFEALALIERIIIKARHAAVRGDHAVGAAAHKNFGFGFDKAVARAVEYAVALCYGDAFESAAAFPYRY